MNKEKFYLVIIVCLVISNLVFLYGYIHRPKMNHSPREIIIEKLEFNPAQIEKYDKIIHIHRSNMNKNRTEMLALRNELYSNINENNQYQKSDSILSELGKLTVERERITYNHLQEIQTICNSEQLKKFKNLTKEFANLFEPPKPPRDRENH